METLAFWVVVILSYLALYVLAGTRGIGYTEHVDTANKVVTFDLNPFLWFPDVFLHSYPATNPAPFLLWWVVVSILVAQLVMVLFRLRGRPRLRTSPVASRTVPAKAQDSTPR